MSPRLFLVAAFVVFVALGGEAATLGPAGPGVAARLGVGLASAGLLVPAHNLGALFGILWWGRAQGRVPAARLHLVGAVLLATAAGLVALHPAAAAGSEVGSGGGGSLLVLLLGAVLLGVGFGLVDVGVNTVLTEHRASAGVFNALHATYGVGAVSLPLVLGERDLRAAMLVALLLVAASLPGLARTPQVRRPVRDRATAAGSRPFVVLLGVAMGVEVGTAAWAPVHLVAQGSSPAVAARTVAAYFAAFTLVRFVIAPFVARWELAVVVRTSLVAAGLAAVAALVGRPTLAWVAVGIGIGPVFPTTMAWLAAVTGDPQGATRLMIGASIGGIGLPVATGGVVALVGPGSVPVVIATIAAVAAAIAWRLPRAGVGRAVVRPGPVGP